ncbi:hypothetical protein [Actinomadura sp. K4S16]|uniref:hypothetical protein n=1 Tax=Actinomadura sp. K4S16 TaxID=1316147 RepID=UPI0011EBAD7F|nr:hypothetical protein [Actinomadura sp. K4S16]
MFVLLGWAWDVALAAQEATRYPVTHATVAEAADLSRPLLAVPLPEVRTPIVNDGWHRIHKARQTGITELLVIFLDVDDERACRLMSGSIERRW